MGVSFISWEFTHGISYDAATWEICISGPTVMGGYLSNPLLKAKLVMLFFSV
jgi:hypothetical protein